MSVLLAFTLFHTALSLIAIVVGIPAMSGLLGRTPQHRATEAFLALAIATSVTGFLFPFNGVTPAFLTGIAAMLVLGAVLLARYRFAGVPLARRVYAGGMVVSLYLLVFVAVVQAYLKVPFLNRLAPTGTEPAFVGTQLAVLLGFAVLGVAAVRAAGPAGLPSATAPG